jgi:imidazolonepropionase-like amidohydrolase
MDAERTLPNYTVIVDGGKITVVGPADTVSAPDGARVIDARGKFLIPGLADMHSHATDEDDRLLYMASGVTSLRVLIGSPASVILRDRIERGEVVGPSVYTAGPMLDGSPPVWPASMVPSIELTDPAAIKPLLARHKRFGLDMIKVYSRLSLPVYEALATAAKAEGMRLVGHVPELVGLERALALGQGSIEHLDGYASYLQAPGSPHAGKKYYTNTLDVLGWAAAFDHIDERRVPEVVAKTKAFGVWNCPTLVASSRYARMDQRGALLKQPGLEYVSPEVLAFWDPSNIPFLAKAAPAEYEAMRRALPNELVFVKALHDGGANLLAGTDSPNPFVIAGFSLLEELELFVEAGLSPYAAIETATRAAARFLRAEQDFGTIAPGRRADLVLLLADPLADIKNLRRRAGVMVRGHYLPEEELKARMDALAAVYKGKRSWFEGRPPLPSRGQRQWFGRYAHRAYGVSMGEVRHAIEALPDSTLLSVTEKIGKQGSSFVWLELGADRAGRTLRVEEMESRIEARREGGELVATATSPLESPASGKAAIEKSALLVGPSLAMAASLHARLAELAAGQKAEIALRTASGGMQHDFSGVRVSVDELILGVERKPDAKRSVLGADKLVRIYAGELRAKGEKQAWTIVLDEAGRLVEATSDNEVFTRVE